MIKTRPRRRLDAQALALDAPLPFVPTCAGMRLSWPSGSQDAQDKPTPAQPLLRATPDAPTE